MSDSLPDEVSESKFNMWRAVIHLAHADGVVSDEEHQFITGYLNRLPFSGPQRDQLEKELKDGSQMDDIFGGIDEPSDRAQVVHFARILCHRDGDFHPNEKALLEKLHSSVMDQANLSSAIAASAKLQAGHEYRKALERSQKNPIARSSLWRAFFD